MEQKESIGPFRVIGIQVRTSNVNGQAGKDLKHLWDRFFRECIMEKIPQKTSNDIYAIYTDYESDYRGAYTTILGCRSTSTDSVPEGFISKDIGGGIFTHFTAKGKLPGAVIHTWETIWSKEDELKRAYEADIEIYDPESLGKDEAEVAIYVGTK